MMPSDKAHRQNAHGHSDHENGYGQRGQNLVWRQHVPNDRARGVDHHRVRPCQRLSQGEANDISPLVALGEFDGRIVSS